MQFDVIERVPSASEYLSLRESVGWHILDLASTKLGLERSLYSVCVLKGDAVVGCGRVVGDGGIYFYIQDVIICPQYQRCGLGTRVMEKLMGYVDVTAKPGAFIGLLAAPGLSEFYGHFGFNCFPDDSPGMLIWK